MTELLFPSFPTGLVIVYSDVTKRSLAGSSNGKIWINQIFLPAFARSCESKLSRDPRSLGSKTHRPPISRFGSDPDPLPDRLMVGLRFLVPSIGVRAPVRQQVDVTEHVS